MKKNHRLRAFAVPYVSGIQIQPVAGIAVTVAIPSIFTTVAALCGIHLQREGCVRDARIYGVIHLACGVMAGRFTKIGTLKKTVKFHL